MKHIVAVMTVVVLLVSASPARAADTVIRAKTAGLELCEQAVCGAAIFVGVLAGRVDSNPFALGTFAVAITHQIPLPGEGASIFLTGGAFEIRVGLRRIRGTITPGGTLLNEGGNRFRIQATLHITEGGSGDVDYNGVLDHNPFPPTVVGNIN